MPHRCTNCDASFPDGSKQMLSGCPNCGGNKFQYLPEDAVDDPPTEEPPEPPEPPGGSGLDGTVTETVGRAATTVKDYVNQHRSTDRGSDSSISASASATDADSTDRGSQPQPETGTSASTETPETASGGESSGPESGTGDTGPDTTPEPSPKTTPDTPSIDPDEGAEVTDDSTSTEDTAQASARTDVANISELTGDSDADSTEEPTATESEPGTAPPETGGRVVKEPDTTDRPDLETLRQELNSQFESIKIIEPGQYELNLMELYDREEHIIALQEDGKYIIEVPESWRDDEPDDSPE